jgi:3-methyladenine DNA glycosylase AlkD
MRVALQDLTRELQHLKNPSKAALLQRFFKTGKGEYGEGDFFLGIVMPQQRMIVKKYAALPLSDVKQLLASKVHEHRMVALLILVQQFQKGDDKRRKEIFNFYLDNASRINNWDLVDLSAPNIVGTFLLDKKRTILSKLARSKNLWERRIAVLATAAFIRNKEYQDTLAIAHLLLHDRHDLIHKACGWMLREVGKRDRRVLEDFLKEHAKTMPRTMLRYAIEKFDEKKRKAYLSIRG